jgi:hypothetical protein
MGWRTPAVYEFAGHVADGPVMIDVHVEGGIPLLFDLWRGGERIARLSANEAWKQGTRPEILATQGRAEARDPDAAPLPELANRIAPEPDDVLETQAYHQLRERMVDVLTDHFGGRQDARRVLDLIFEWRDLTVRDGLSTKDAARVIKENHGVTLSQVQRYTAEVATLLSEAGFRNPA